MDPLQTDLVQRKQESRPESSTNSFKRFKEMLGSKTQFDQLTGDVLDTIGEYLDL